MSLIRVLAKIQIQIQCVLLVFASVSLFAVFSSEVTDYPRLKYIKTEYICQNETMILQCPSPSLLEVQATSFGRAMSAICANGANADRSCDLIDKKDLVKQMCDYKSACQIVANAEMFGNDCPGVDKYLNVIFACVLNPDVKTPLQPITTRPITTANQTTTPITTNATNAPNATRSATTPAPKPAPLLTAASTTKNAEKETAKPIIFNPNGPDLDFLSRNSGVHSLSVGIASTHTLIVTGVATLIVFISKNL